MRYFFMKFSLRLYLFKRTGSSNPDLGMQASQSAHLGPPCQVKRVSLANRGRLASYKHILKEVSVVYVFVAIQCMCVCRVFCYCMVSRSLLDVRTQNRSILPVSHNYIHEVPVSLNPELNNLKIFVVSMPLHRYQGRGDLFFDPKAGHYIF